jgi:hypothetical protein
MVSDIIMPNEQQELTPLVASDPAFAAGRDADKHCVQNDGWKGLEFVLISLRHNACHL